MRVMAEGDCDAQTRIQTLLEYIHEREVELEERSEQKRIKLHQCVQLRHLENEARQVNMWIRNSESMITAGLVCPGSLHEAEQLRKEHDQFQPAIEARFLRYFFVEWLLLTPKRISVTCCCPVQLLWEVCAIEMCSFMCNGVKVFVFLFVQ